MHQYKAKHQSVYNSDNSYYIILRTWLGFKMEVYTHHIEYYTFDDQINAIMHKIMHISDTFTNSTGLRVTFFFSSPRQFLHEFGIILKHGQSSLVLCVINEIYCTLTT